MSSPIGGISGRYRAIRRSSFRGQDLRNLTTHLRGQLRNTDSHGTADCSEHGPIAHLPHASPTSQGSKPAPSNTLASPDSRWLHRCLSIAPSLFSAFTGQRVMHSQQLPSWK